MQSVKVRLRKKRGRGWEYQEIEIPTDSEMERIAAELHANHVPNLTSCLGWKVLYRPASPYKCLLPAVDPFTGERGETVEHQSSTLSCCVFGYDAEWQVCYSWNRGDDQSPVRIQEKGDVVPLPSETQGDLFFQSGEIPKDNHDGRPLVEGKATKVELNRYERSGEARKRCIAHYGTACSVCGFEFGKVYGEMTDGFIHVHHLNPLSEINAEHAVDPVRDLRPVCLNCHEVLHMRAPAFDIEQLSAVIEKRSSKGL